MKKQIPHKIALIALLLIAFGVPFMFVHTQGTQLSYNDYVVSAGVVNGSSVAPTTTTAVPTIDSNSRAWLQVSGQSFIGSNVK